MGLWSRWRRSWYVITDRSLDLLVSKTLKLTERVRSAPILFASLISPSTRTPDSSRFFRLDESSSLSHPSQRLTRFDPDLSSRHGPSSSRLTFISSSSHTLSLPPYNHAVSSHAEKLTKEHRNTSSHERTESSSHSSQFHPLTPFLFT